MLMLYSEELRVKTPGNRVFLLEAHLPEKTIHRKMFTMIISEVTLECNADLSKLG